MCRILTIKGKNSSESEFLHGVHFLVREAVEGAYEGFYLQVKRASSVLLLPNSGASGVEILLPLVFFCQFKFQSGDFEEVAEVQFCEVIELAVEFFATVFRTDSVQETLRVATQ